MNSEPLVVNPGADQLGNYQPQLDEIEQSTRLLIMSSKTLLEQAQAQRETDRSLSGELQQIQGQLQALATQMAQQKTLLAQELERVEAQIRQMQALPQHHPFDWRTPVMMAVLFISIGGLYTGFWWQPATHGLNQMLLKQQRLLNRVLICVVRPQESLCHELRQSLTQPQPTRTKP